MIPDWQLPPGVDRGLWDYLHSEEMVAGYDEQMSASALATVDVRYCDEQFSQPGKLIDLGCGTGRLSRHFTARGFTCVGIDLSEEMLAVARKNAPAATFLCANLVDLTEVAAAEFDYAACLFSTLGMIRGEKPRRQMLRNVQRLLKPGGTFVVHAHNRWYWALGWKRFRGGDITMPQAYGGAPLTLHHFTPRELVGELRAAHLEPHTIQSVSARGELAKPSPWRPWSAYGYLVAARKV